MIGNVRVSLWGTTVGYLGYPPGQNQYAVFEYDPLFMNSGIQISPLHLRCPPSWFAFNQLSYKNFQGLPGFIADSLPDKYGNQLIDIYMAEKKISASEITALDRLNYVANRGMGALEYKPGEILPLQRTALDLQHLSDLAELVLGRKEKLYKKLVSAEDAAAALTMIRIGSSAGGARSKALVALSPKGTVLDGTVNHGPDYTYWLLKFDSSSNKDRDTTDPKGMPVVEYIYSLMAKKSGIRMPRTDIINDGGNRHFLIERFDRIIRNRKLDKVHYVSWAGLSHADRDGVNSYEQLILLVRQMNLGHSAIKEVFRRAVFNILGRNQDDHTKNTGFLMDRTGNWRLAPAFDITYSYDPMGRWTKNHQSWLNQKNNDFQLRDLLEFGRYCELNEKTCRNIIHRTRDSLSEFSRLAVEYEISDDLKKTIETNLRLHIVP
ncbi:MAG: HipA domain-containing protein [Spirochaetales bacterium]|nr:HipA domain-containing protein [Spirochaetales bacterium]